MPLLPQITTLIEKRDNRELVRDQIAAILKVESAHQQALADEASQDPSRFALRVFSERTEPWAAVKASDPQRVPIVNVWFDSGNFEKNGSDLIKHQKFTGTFNVDCYGFGVAEETLEGHTSADKKAVEEAERAVRLSRNILMSSFYTYLGFPQGRYLPQGQQQVVWSRWTTSIQAFQIPVSDRPTERVAAYRLALEVTMSEFSPQYVPETLELISSTLERTPDGEWLSAEYDYSAPDPEEGSP